ncbi:MAG: chalcone isomerase family protein [Pseudomonadota bacterium]
MKTRTTLLNPSARPWVHAACALALVVASLGAPAIAAPAFGPTQTVQGTPLMLQGTGTRYRAVFKVYDMALYLPRKVRTAEEILATTGPMRLDFVAQRDIPGTDLGLSFIKGLSANATPDQIRRHTPSSNRLVEIFSGRTRLASGDTFAMEFVPGKGTTFYIQGQAQGAPVGDAEYFGMVLRIWLGASPVDNQLKDALLSAGTN